MGPHLRTLFRIWVPKRSPFFSRSPLYPISVGWFLFWWNLAFQFLHGFKLFHFVHRFQNCFCFRSTTFPSAVRTFGQRLLVLHCNYNGAVAPKFDLVITFDWGVLLTQGQRVWTAFCKIFSGIPHLTIFSTLKYAAQILYLAVFARVIERVFRHAKKGQVGCPWKDPAKWCSDALIFQ